MNFIYDIRSKWRIEKRSTIQSWTTTVIHKWSSLSDSVRYCENCMSKMKSRAAWCMHICMWRGQLAIIRRPGGPEIHDDVAQYSPGPHMVTQLKAHGAPPLQRCSIARRPDLLSYCCAYAYGDLALDAGMVSFIKKQLACIFSPSKKTVCLEIFRDVTSPRKWSWYP